MIKKSIERRLKTKANKISYQTDKQKRNKFIMAKSRQVELVAQLMTFSQSISVANFRLVTFRNDLAKATCVSGDLVESGRCTAVASSPVANWFASDRFSSFCCLTLFFVRNRSWLLLVFFNRIHFVFSH